MNIRRKAICCTVVLLHCLQFSTLYAQDTIDEPYFGDDDDTYMEDEASEPLPADDPAPATSTVPEASSPEPANPVSGAAARSQYNTGPNASTSVQATDPALAAAEETGFQNAIIEGVQLTAEPGSEPDEKLVTGYFIFRDKPSSYFYEVKLREKKLIFEFNDTRVGTSPVPTASEPPIKGFVIEQGKIDVNKAVKGLRPEWHDLIRVVFDLEAVPDVHVNDEYSIISFSFKWTSDPSKQKKYTVKDKTPKIILWSSAGVGGVALGAVAYFLLRPDEGEKPLAELPVNDLPVHQVP